MSSKSIRAITKSGLFDRKYYAEQGGDYGASEAEAILHFLEHGASGLINPSADFDVKWYQERYLDVTEAKVNPLLHYIKHGRKEGRYATSKDEGKLLSSKDEGKLPSSKSIRAITNRYLVIPYFFNSKVYFENNPELSEKEILGLFHYIRHGRKEGRVGLTNYRTSTSNGTQNYDPNKPTILFIIHESSATGAPILALSLMRSFQPKYNVACAIIKPKNITTSFYESSFIVQNDIQGNETRSLISFLKLLKKKYHLKGIIVNSAVAYKAISPSTDLNIPSLLMVNEYAHNVYPFGLVLKALSETSRAIFPATEVLVSYQSKAKEQNLAVGFLENKSSIIPQGKIPTFSTGFGDNLSVGELKRKLKLTSEDDKIVIVGAGTIDQRKGVDLFLDVAHLVVSTFGINSVFVWVGSSSQVKYFKRIQNQIIRYGLQENFIFLDHQSSLENIFSISDVFCLTSRRDPFPNVVIDALASNLHITCFEEASGFPSFLKKYEANYSQAPYLNVKEMAKNIKFYLSKDIYEHRKSTKNINLVKQHLCFDTYADSVDACLVDITSNHKRGYSPEMKAFLNFENGVDDENLSKIDVSSFTSEFRFLNLFALEDALSADIIKRVKSIAAKWQTEDMLSHVVNELISSGFVTEFDPRTGVTAQSRHSVRVGLGNFLRFVSIDGAPFYIYQEDYTAEFLYFPDEQLIIHFKEKNAAPRVFTNYLKKLIRFSSNYFEYFKRETHFDGVIVEHPSPYHYYYLKVGALKQISDQLLIISDKKVKIITGSKGCFLPLEKLFPKVVSEQVTRPELQKSFLKGVMPHECASGSFGFIIGFRWKTLQNSNLSAYQRLEIQKRFSRLDLLLREASAHHRHGSDYKKVLEQREGVDILFWFGLTTGKRRLVNDLHFLNALIDELNSNNLKVGVIIDGMTSPIDVRQKAPAIYSKELKIFQKICQNLSEKAQVFSVIGFSALEKIEIGKLIDFFVANNATGSIWVSRVLHKPGVTHISNKARISSIRQHLHPRAKLLPNEMVLDIDDHKEPFSVSYKVNVSESVSYVIEQMLSSPRNSEIYEEYLSIEMGRLSPNLLDFSADDVFGKIMPNITFVDEFDNVSLKQLLSLSEASNLNEFRGQCENGDFEAILFGGMSKEHGFKILDPLSGLESYCCHSVSISWTNYLRFSSQDGPFYIFQFNYTCEAVFFPNRKLCFVFKTNMSKCEALINTKKRLGDLISQIFKFKRSYHDYFLGKNNFGGIKVHHNSPYHFYYFKMIELFRLSETSLANTFPTNAICPQQGTFFLLENIWPQLFCATKFLEPRAQMDGVKGPPECVLNEYYVGIGSRLRSEFVCPDEAVTQELQKLDNVVLNSIKSPQNNNHLEAIEGLNWSDYDFILWFGISSGKRKWIEQKQFIEALSTELTHRFNHPLILIDGWTGFESNEDTKPPRNAYGEDENIAAAIIENLAEGVSGISIVGLCALSKLTAARRANYFVANHATGSIWISRVSGVSGTTHISNAARDSSINQHYHKSSSLIPSEIVVDKETSGNTNFHVSYSISVQEMLLIVLEDIDKIQGLK